VYCKWIQGDSRPLGYTSSGYRQIADQYNVFQVDTGPGDSRPMCCIAGGYREIAGQCGVLQVDTGR
jgi:hypothetical protein